MQLIQLEYLLALDTYRSIDQAAEACFVSEAVFRKQIKKLENELGRALFEKKVPDKPIYPTPIGVLIIEQSRLILQEVKRMKDIIQDEEDLPSGELRLGIIPTLAQYLVPYFIGHYAANFPQVNLYIEELLTDDIITKLRSGALDAGLCSTPLKLEGIFERPLFYERMLLYVSVDHPFFDRDKIKLNEISTEDLWLLQEGNTFRTQVMMLLDKKQSNEEINRQPFERSSIENLKYTIEHQYGITILPELATLDLQPEQKKMVKRIISPKPVREISLITHQSCLKFKLIETLYKEIATNVPEKMKDEKRGLIVPVRF
jgi:LysR family transcriptional regulator, hydrogen peroxide-inducible genes activator